MVVLVKGKVLIAIVIVAILFSAYQIVAHPTNFEKANSKIAPQQQSVKISAQEVEQYSKIFENSLNGCKQMNGPQKNFVQTTSPTGMLLAANLANGKKSDLEKAKTFFNYASNEIEYKKYDNWRTTSEVLETKAGDCTDKSIVLVSMLKDAGIESYVVYGKKIDGYSHAWVSAKINGKWLQLDPTAGDFNYVYSCIADKNCKYNKYYLPIEGIFDENRVLKCEN